MIIIGTGGHARVVAEVAKLLKFEVRGFLDLDYSGRKEEILGFPVLGGIDRLELIPRSSSFFVAVGDNGPRKKLFQEMISRDFKPVTLIHPSVIISEEAVIGKGTFIGAGSIINTNAQIGDNSIINTGVIIDHETTIGRDSHIAPGCRIAGRVKIGEGTFVGIGASLIDKIKLGDGVIVGAGTVIIEDVPSFSKIVGVPGRVLE